MRHRSVDNRSITDVAIDRLGDFLLREMETPTLADQIPDGAHLFHGAFDDSELTQRSLQLAGDILLGMLLGYVKEAPLLMLYEYHPEQETLLDISSETHKQGALDAIHALQRKSMQAMQGKLERLAIA